MASIRCARTTSVEIEANRVHKAPLVSAAGIRNVVQLFALALGAASLAACAQSSVVTQKSELSGASRQASLEQSRKTSSVTTRRVAVTRKHTPFASPRNAGEAQVATPCEATCASPAFLGDANGEKFDTQELTAAHRTLPFGTRLRVTNVATGRSVTVRVNDRGPFVPGRDVDVSYAAAETLGMVGGGIAKVKLDVVQ